MNPTNPNLPRPQYSARFPRPGASQPPPVASAALPIDESATAAESDSNNKLAELGERGSAFVRTHWKKIGLVALGLLGWRSRLLRPLVRKALKFSAVPLARGVLARVRG